MFLHKPPPFHSKHPLLPYSLAHQASPYDRIWGIGYGAAKADANRESWGENLLGKALMRVRERLRREIEKGD